MDAGDYKLSGKLKCTSMRNKTTTHVSKNNRSIGMKTAIGVKLVVILGVKIECALFSFNFVPLEDVQFVCP